MPDILRFRNTRFASVATVWFHMRWFDHGHYISIRGLPYEAITRIGAFIRPVCPQSATFGARKDALDICHRTRFSFVRAGRYVFPHGVTRLLAEAYWCRISWGCGTINIVQTSLPNIELASCAVLLGALVLFLRPSLDLVTHTAICPAVGLSASSRFSYLHATGAVAARDVHESYTLPYLANQHVGMAIYIGLSFSPSGRYLGIHGLLDASLLVARFLSDCHNVYALEGTLYVAYLVRFSLSWPHHGWSRVHPWPRWQPTFVEILPRAERLALEEVA